MKTLLHALLLNALWLAAVLGVAHDRLLPALIVFSMLICVVVQEGISQQDVLALVIGLVVGFMVDGFLQSSGWVQYESWWPIAGWSPPYWILMLWVGFALTLKIGMRWLFRSYLMGTVFLCVGAPLSYYSAAKLGAVNLQQPVAVMALIGVSWWCYYSLVYAFNKSWRLPYEPH